MKSQYITPAITVFDEKGDLDCEALRGLYDHLIQGGVNGILILGSIGEFFAIPLAKKKELINLAVKHIQKRVPVMVGIASMEVAETIELSKYAYEVGADSVILVSPYYFGLTDLNLEAYYDYVASQCPIDLYLYNFPDRTGYELSPNLVLNLARKHANIVGIKDTISGMDHTRELIKIIKPEFPKFKIYSGFDDNFAHNVMAGGDGCIAGLSNLFPELCSSWVKAFEGEDLRRVADIQQSIDRLMSIYQVGKPFVPYIKRAMRMKGLLEHDYCTFPLPCATESDEIKLKHIIEQAQQT